MPKAYVVGMIKVNNMEGFAPYKAAIDPSIAEHGGRFIVRHRDEKLHAEDDPNPITVVIEFPDAESAMAWKNSDNYQAILPSRLDNSEGPLVICEGVE
jgi:uncharacterized protein (DUF1330 family)